LVVQDIIRWIIEAAPTVPIGIMLVAVLGWAIPMLASLWVEPRARRQAEETEALQAKLEALSPDASAEERAGLVMPNLFRIMQPALEMLAAVFLLLGLSIWVYFSVWAVAAKLPGIWSQSVWWAGLLVGSVKAVVAFVTIRRLPSTISPELVKLLAWSIAVPFLVLTGLYLFAPLGCLLYSATAWVIGFSFAQHKRLQAPDQTPNILVLFLGF